MRVNIPAPLNPEKSNINKGCFCTGSANQFRSTVIAKYESFIAWLSVYGDFNLLEESSISNGIVPCVVWLSKIMIMLPLSGN
jgi:hypothetical protein